MMPLLAPFNDLNFLPAVVVAMALILEAMQLKVLGNFEALCFEVSSDRFEPVWRGTSEKVRANGVSKSRLRRSESPRRSLL